ncbi:hypothetical protein LTR05_002817 [Lithohypha guttulata]|uniref:Zn(2)-C6 fungal-type domain-containing protein n=1 Tax=Lithohypha guttulata TaxID=1690604 RepID=A0AAN7T2V5_9EURO|nr:hypothetical protein LTR05_002817 [Lithohypha guttulata]
MEADAGSKIETNTSGPILPKACENCRIRKIRCNRQNPCSNCETSGINCRPAAKTTEQRSRVLLSANYEKQIEQINDRLTGIEDAIKTLRLTPVSPNNLPESGLSSGSDVSRSQITTPTAFEGASSFTSQAIQASQAAGRSLERLSGSAEVVDALSSLRNLVKPAGFGIIKHDLRLGTSVLPRVLPEIQLLPAQFVLTLLQEFRTRISALFLAYAFRDHKQLERLCQQIYFPTEPVTLASLTLMNGMIFYMIKELLFEGSYGACKDYDLKSYHDQAERNFHLGVETYEVFTHPSLESTKVLMLAMLKAQEEGKPLLAWTFASTGCRQVLNLGYHRKASLRNDPVGLAEDKRQVFWTFYMVDKNLSLNMGYSSTLQDNDIDAEYFCCSSDPGIAPWDKAALAMVEISRLQGLIYEKLYSRQALETSPEVKAQVINELSPQLQRWYEQWIKVDSSSSYLPTFFFIIYGAFDVVYYSVVTTMHRAATPSNTSVEITSACYEAAKKSLQAHLHFFPSFKSYGDAEILGSYVAWILLYASWTPLIVVFLHAIASSNREDVRLLEETEISLEPLKNLNQQSEQVYCLCKIFCKLAKAFVERRSTFVGSYNPQQDMVVIPQQDLQEFHHNLPTGTQSMPITQAVNWAEAPDPQVPNFDGSEMDGMSMFLGNWFGNQPVSNLWNMDFTENLE